MHMKTEKIAIPYHEQRISPLIDLSEHFIITEVNDGKKSGQEQINLQRRNELSRYDDLLNIR